MLSAIDQYFLEKEEPTRSCLQFLRQYLLRYDAAMTETWKYSMPFYCYDGKRMCYLWTRPKTQQPYIGIVDGNRIEDPLLLQEKRSRMKILLLDPAEDLPIAKIDQLLAEMIRIVKTRK